MRDATACDVRMLERIDRLPDQVRHQDAKGVGNADQRQTGQNASAVRTYVGEDTTQLRHDRKKGHGGSGDPPGTAKKTAPLHDKSAETPLAHALHSKGPEPRDLDRESTGATARVQAGQ